MRHLCDAAVVALCVLALPARSSAAVRLPYILTDHLVVQRDEPVHVWGMATPGERVSVTFREHRRATVADDLGRWSVYLPPGPAGGPFDLLIEGANQIRLRDVLAGDVWIAAGQSNMEWPVRWSAEPAREMAAARFPNIRLVRTMHRVSEHPLEQFVGQTWAPCTPESVEHFSAVAYHFAREIHEKARVPVGVIQTAWGGTPIEAWTPLSAIAEEPALMPVFAEWSKLMAAHETSLLEFPRRLREWERAVEEAKAQGRTPPDRPELRRRPGGQWMPSGLFNAMVAPLTKMPVRGVIWYQGEANTAPERAPLYERLFQTLIRGWRRAWHRSSLPFLFVQLANYRGAEDGMWPEVREAQRKALQLAHTAMAVTIDIGNPVDIHPRNKREAGRRLALAARALVYGEAVEHSGPLFRMARRGSGGVRIWFDHCGGGLVSRGTLAGFEAAGEDGVFQPEKARIEGCTVVVESPNARSVRYAWKDDPPAPLSNAAGLPASPFLSDKL